MMATCLAVSLAPFLVKVGYGIVLFGILKRPKKAVTVDIIDNKEDVDEKESNEKILDDKSYTK